MSQISESLAPCPDCGSRTFDKDPQGNVMCICGLYMPNAPHPPSTLHEGAQSLSTVPQDPPHACVARRCSGGIADSQAGAQGRAEPSPGPKPALKKKGVAGKGRSKSQLQNWYGKVAKGLGGIPRFVLTEAQRIRRRALEDPETKKKPEHGIALAALDHALHRYQLHHERKELCAKSGSGPKEGALRVEECTLQDCYKVVLRQEKLQNVPPPPPCTPTQYAVWLCEDLPPKGRWSKSAGAVAKLAAEEGLGRDKPPMILAAAVCMLVFDRHPPKDKIDSEQIAEVAGVNADDLRNCYIYDLLPHMQALFNASEEAILPSQTVSLDAPAPPTLTPAHFARQKPPSRRRQKSSSAGGEAAGNAEAGAVGTFACDALAPGPAAAESSVDSSVTGTTGRWCSFCAVSLSAESHSDLCPGCEIDRCWQCGRVDPIAIDERRHCFGCMRESLLRRRWEIGALRGFRAVEALAPQPEPAFLTAQRAPTPPQLQRIPTPPQLLPQPPRPGIPTSPLLPRLPTPPQPQPQPQLTGGVPPLDRPMATPQLPLQLQPTGGTPPFYPQKITPPLAPSQSSLPPAMASLPGTGDDTGSADASFAAATAAAAWERPLSQAGLSVLLSSPHRPSTPLQGGASAPYPFRHTPPHASPHASPMQGAPPTPFAMLREPTLAMLREPTLPLSQSPRPAAGEQRAMVEWAMASSRHPSPAPHLANAQASPFWVGSASLSPHVSSGHGLAAPGILQPSMSTCEPSTIYEGQQLPSPRTLSIAQGGSLMPPPPLPIPSPGLQQGAAGVPFAEPSPVGRRSPRFASPALLLERPATDPRSSPCWSAGASAMPVYDRPATDPRAPSIPPFDRPSTDPRSSPCWSATASSMCSLAPKCLDRPPTDPSRSPKNPSWTQMQPPPRRSPRYHPYEMPRVRAGASPYIVSASPRTLGTMLPPPPRNKPPLEVTTSSDSVLTDQDVEQWLEPGPDVGLLQYGTHKGLLEAYYSEEGAEAEAEEDATLSPRRAQLAVTTPAVAEEL